MHVVISNGPPFSGKDTLTKHLLKRFPHAVWMRFKDVLYKETHKDLFVHEDGEEITLDEWIEICNNIVLKDTKLPWSLDRESIMSWINNPGLFSSMFTRTPRNVLIDKSEKEIKVEHGEGGVAVITAGYIKEIEDYQSKLIIFSDGGFNVEKGVLCEELGITEDDLTVIRIDAEGCNFDNDSREYIENPKFTLFNDKTEKFLEIIDKEICSYLPSVNLSPCKGTLKEVLKHIEPQIKRLNKYEPICYYDKSRKMKNVFHENHSLDEIEKYITDNDILLCIFDIDNDVRVGIINFDTHYECEVTVQRPQIEFNRSQAYVSMKVNLNLCDEISEEDQFKSIYELNNHNGTRSSLFVNLDEIVYPKDVRFSPHFRYENSVADVQEISSDNKTAVLRFKAETFSHEQLSLIESISPVFYGTADKIDYFMGFVINDNPAMIKK